MQECLGISINNKLIRYARVSKNNDSYNVTSYGIKFYDNIDTAINQILSETDNHTIPVSSEISNEKYYYFNIFSLANRNYAEKAIKTEFESFCAENHLNKNLYDSRYIYTKNIQNQDQSKIIYVYDSKNELAERKAAFGKADLETLVPMTTTLPNLMKVEKNRNSMIINLEERTTITTIINQAIYNVDILDEGMEEVLDKISERENSYSKAYEICKNSTIYTMETTEGTGNNEYLQYIVPTLYKILQEIQKIKERFPKIDNIYLTGMGTVINNIDLYFKEYFKESKVEILKPFFLEDKMNINIKDYIEVNSAIALALQGLGLGIKNLNFMKRDWKTELKTLLSSDVNMKDIKMPKFNFKLKNKNVNLKSKVDLSGELDRVERLLLRDCAVVLIVIIMYSVGSSILVKQINAKIKETDDVTLYANSQLSLANSDSSKVNERTKDYQKYKTNLENVSSAIETKRSRKNQITTMLNKIVYNIPKEVQLTEIKNTETTDSGKTVQHIIIHAQSTKYEQLAYFKAKMKNANVLDNITSTEGQKDGEYVKIIIEGDLKTY